MWRDIIFMFLFGKLERSLKFVEGIVVQYCVDKGRVGFEDMVDLSQGIWEIVDLVYVERVYDEIEVFWFVWKCFFVIYDMVCDIDFFVEWFISIVEQQFFR